MKLDEAKKIKHVAWVIAAGFFGSVIAFIASWFFPPDFSTHPPTYDPWMMRLGQMQTALYILGCTGLGLKLAEEKKTLPSIGFTMMAIAQGVIFVLYLISSAPTEDQMHEAYKMFSASLFLLIPSMILIAFYSEFPRWLNILGILSCIPYIIENILYSTYHEFNDTIMNVDGVGLVLTNIVAVSWGILILRNVKNEIARMNSSQ